MNTPGKSHFGWKIIQNQQNNLLEKVKTKKNRKKTILGAKNSKSDEIRHEQHGTINKTTNPS